MSVAVGLTLLMVLPSCDSDDGDTIAVSDRRKICVLFSSGGLGDDGYNDMIWRGLQNFTLSRRVAAMFLTRHGRRGHPADEQLD